jgi:hypothetical protein
MMNNVTVSLPLFLCLGVLYFYQRVNKMHFGPISLMICLYVLVFSCGLVLELLGLSGNSLDYSLTAVSFLSIAVGCVLYAFSYFRDAEQIKFEVENANVKALVDFIFLLSNIGAIVFFLPTALAAISGDIDANRNDNLLLTEGLAAMGLVNTYFSAIASCFGVSLVLGFSNIVGRSKCYPNARGIGWALLVTSLCYVIYVLAYVGRDGIVLWSILFLFTYLIFRHVLEPRVRRNMRRLFMASILMALPVFALITYSRFAHLEHSIPVWILLYLGQQVANFSDYFQAFNDSFSQGSAGTFPILQDVGKSLGLQPSEFVAGEVQYEYYLLQGVVPWRFATFIGSWVKAMGPYSTCVTLGFFVILSRMVSSKRTFTVSRLIFFSTLAQVPLFGIFYFTQYSQNYGMLLAALVGFVLFLSKKRN